MLTLQQSNANHVNQNLNRFGRNNFVIRREINFLRKRVDALARWRNNLHFHMHCKHNNITPHYLQIKTLARGIKVPHIIRQAERALISSQITTCTEEVTTLLKTITRTEHRLQRTLSAAAFTHVNRTNDKHYYKAFNKARATQIKKFHKIKQQQQQRTHGPAPNPATTPAHNTSPKTLTPAPFDFLPAFCRAPTTTTSVHTIAMQTSAPTTAPKTISITPSNTAASAHAPSTLGSNDQNVGAATGDGDGGDIGGGGYTSAFGGEELPRQRGHGPFLRGPDGEELCAEVTAEEADKIRKSWVKNDEDIPLDEITVEALQDGLTFKPTPKDLPAAAVIVAVEAAARLMGPDSEQAANIRNVALRKMKAFKQTRRNTTNAKNAAINRLKLQRTIVIGKADKGTATVVMREATYRLKMRDIVTDRTTYLPLKSDPTASYKRELTTYLLHRVKRKGYVSEAKYHLMRPSTNLAPRIFGQPKIHKDGTPLRQIIAGRTSITKGTTKELARIIGPLTGKTKHHVKDSKHLVSFLHNLVVKPDHILASFDLVGMFTNIPFEQAIEKVGEMLRNDTTLKDRTKMPVETILDLLKMTTRMTYFVWEGDHYQQTKGGPMGSSTSSPLSDAYMEWFEHHATTAYDTKDQNKKPEDILQFWLRKADDTLVSIHKDHIAPFLEWLNTIHSDLKWTCEVEKEGRINFLDVTIIRDSNGSLTFEVYRKPTHTGQYIQATSNAPRSHMISTVRALTQRAYDICSTPEARERELARVRKELAINGYSLKLYNRGRYRPNAPGASGAGTQAITDPNSQSTGTTPSRPESTTRKGHVQLPHIPGISDILARLCRKEGISTSFTSRGSLGEQLVHLKDPIDRLDTSDTIYHIKCGGGPTTDCNHTYVGETGRSTRIRMGDHRASTKHGDQTYASPVYEHTFSEDHYFGSENVTVLDTDDNWSTRGLKEAVFIKATQPDLNRDQGRGKIPGFWTPTIRRFITPGALRRIEADKGRTDQGWSITATQNPSQPQTQPQTQAQSPTHHSDPATAGANPGPAQACSTQTTTAKRGPGRPPGPRTSQTTAKSIAPSTHTMTTRRTTRRMDMGDDR